MIIICTLQKADSEDEAEEESEDYAPEGNLSEEESSDDDDDDSDDVSQRQAEWPL